MSAHTPGPWVWTVEDSSMATLHREQGDGGCEDSVLIMTTCSNCAERHRGEPWEWGRCYSPELPNARLIAAAPELLEAVQVTLEMLQGQGPPNWDWLREVVAKATGQ